MSKLVVRENAGEPIPKIGRYLEDSRELLSMLCKISVEYIEVATQAQEGLRDYWASLVKMQLNQIVNLPTYEFMKEELVEPLRDSIVSAPQF